MANLVYTRAKAKFLSGDLDLNTHDIRALLVMSNTTADTEEDTEFISGFTTLDEMDGTGYARVALTGEAVAADTTNDRGEFTSDVITFAGVDAGTRSVTALVLFRFVTNDADSIPIAYIDTDATGLFPFVANGGDIIITPDAEGILQLA